MLVAKGFTLPELAAVLAIVAILAALAAPSFSDLIANQKAAAISADVDAALSVARGEATKRNAGMWLCPTTSGVSGWKDGWRIQDAVCSDSGVGVTIAAAHGAVAGATITGPTSVEYQSSGRVKGGTAPAFTITIVSGLSSVTKYVCADLSGRPRSNSTGCS